MKQLLADSSYAGCIFWAEAGRLAKVDDPYSCLQRPSNAPIMRLTTCHTDIDVLHAE